MTKSLWHIRLPRKIKIYFQDATNHPLERILEYLQDQPFSEGSKFDVERNQVRQASADYAISRIWYYHNESAKSRSR